MFSHAPCAWLPYCGWLEIAKVLVTVTTGLPLLALSCVPRTSQVGEAEKELMGATAANKYASLVDEAEGLDKIEDLQNHEQEEIYDKAANILEAFFDVEDGEVENLAPQVGIALAFSDASAHQSTWLGAVSAAKSHIQDRGVNHQRPRRGSFTGGSTWNLRCMKQ